MMRGDAFKPAEMSAVKVRHFRFRGYGAPIEVAMPSAVCSVPCAVRAQRNSNGGGSTGRTPLPAGTTFA